MLPPDEAMAVIEAHAQVFSEQRRNPLAQQVAEHIAQVGRWSSLTDEERTAVRSFVVRHPDGDANVFAISGLTWCLGHEVAHHLLNHPRRGGKWPDTPAQAYLVDQMAAVELGPPAGLTRQQVREIDADRLAALMLLGPPDARAHAMYGASLFAASGAFVALPALELVDENDSPPPFPGQAARRPSHPPLLDRLADAAKLIERTGVDSPDGPFPVGDTDRTQTAWAGSFALQLWACRHVIKGLLPEAADAPRSEPEAAAHVARDPSRLSPCAT